jgi:hypothetical protein
MIEVSEGTGEFLPEVFGKAAAVALDELVSLTVPFTEELGGFPGGTVASKLH